jgi:organic hydroperoxide reductase OsmC/OhrA
VSNQHSFNVRTNWTGNTGQGTANYRAYKRDYEVGGPTKPAAILGSSDPAFRGDPARYNPEELLMASISACHMLWMLHLCADAGITVTSYSDEASGSMQIDPDGSGRFREVVLNPRMRITDAGRVSDAEALHHRAHEMCFVANSVNFPVRVEGHIEAGSEASATVTPV